MNKIKLFYNNFLSQKKKITVITIFFGFLIAIIFQNCAPQKFNSEFNSLAGGQSKTQNTNSIIPGMLITKDPSNTRLIGSLPNQQPAVIGAPSPAQTPTSAGNPNPVAGAGAPSAQDCLIDQNLFENNTYSLTEASRNSVILYQGKTYLKNSGFASMYTEEKEITLSCKDYYNNKSNSNFKMGEGSLVAGALRVFTGKLGKNLRCPGGQLKIENTEVTSSVMLECPQQTCFVSDLLSSEPYKYFAGDVVRNAVASPSISKGKCREAQLPLQYSKANYYRCSPGVGNASWTLIGEEVVTKNVLYENAKTVIGTNYSSSEQPLDTDTIKQFMLKNSNYLDAYFPVCSSKNVALSQSISNDKAINLVFGTLTGIYKLKGAAETDLRRFAVNQVASSVNDILTFYSVDSGLNATLVKTGSGVYVGSGTTKPVGCSKNIAFEATLTKVGDSSDLAYAYNWKQTECGFVKGESQTILIELLSSSSNISTTVKPAADPVSTLPESQTPIDPCEINSSLCYDSGGGF